MNLVGHDGHEQGNAHGEGDGGDAEDEGEVEGFQIARVGEKNGEVVQPDEFPGKPEGIFHIYRAQQRLAGGVEEKHHRDDKLGQQEEDGQYQMPLAPERVTLILH